MSVLSIFPVGTTAADALFAGLSNMESRRQTLAQTALSRGADRYTAGDYKGAARAFQAAVALDPSHDNAIKSLDLLASAYIQDNNSDAAMQAYKSSISMAPDDDAAHVKLGNIYFSQGSYDAAEQQYQLANRINPNSSTNILSLGQAYLAEGKYQDAEQQFQRVISMDPQHHAGYYALGQTYSKEGRYDEAIQKFQKVISLKSDFYDVYVDLGSAYADNKQMDAAKEQVQVLDDNAPDLAPLLSNYIDTVTNPKFTEAYTTGGFNAGLGPGTTVSNMNWKLTSPNSTALVSMVFNFSKDMDPLSVQNPYNWTISKAQNGAPGGAYNWGLPEHATEVNVAPIPVSVVYDTESATATVSFLIKQNSGNDGTLDPSHIMFKFNGTDIFGNVMDPTADEYGGISKIV